MTNEEMQSTMQFILESQAQFSVHLAQTQETVSRLATQVEYIARQQTHMNEVVASMADHQQHTEERLNVLIDIVADSRGNNGGVS
jgi:septation ring formation regulator EzrA